MPYFRAGLWDWAWVWSLAGQHTQSEQFARQRFNAITKLGDMRSSYQSLRDLGWALGQQGKFDDAKSSLEKAISMRHDLGASAMGFLGRVLTLSGDYENAKQYLRKSLRLKTENRDNPGLPEVFNWLGHLATAQRNWQQAHDYYQQSLAANTSGRQYFYVEALVGLCWSLYYKNELRDWPETLLSAETLAQHYEYNDHLASLHLLKGHLTWESVKESVPDAFETAHSYYCKALIYALRYDRFLLNSIAEELVAVAFRRPEDGILML